MMRTAFKCARIAGLSRQVVRAGWPRGPAILMYHGVTALPESDVLDWDGKHVRAALFREQLDFLRSVRTLVPLTTLVEAVWAGRDASRLLAITFDDGYLNNAATAAPLLSEFGCPATFFLATGFLDRRRWLWNDRIESALHRTQLDQIRLSDDGGRSVPLGTVQARRLAMRTLKARLKKMPWSAAEQEVARLEESLEVEASAPSGVHEFMSWDDARHLQAQGFSLGAHTVNHAILSRVGLDEAEQEILASRNRIQEMLGACSAVFCYPNGKRSDYSGETTAFCAKHFQAALSAELGYAQASDLFELKRIPVDNATTVSRLARLLLEAY